jgi:hypothetical protein
MGISTCSVAHLHRKLKTLAQVFIIFNTMMHTITGDQINLFVCKQISDMHTVKFKELSMYDISCMI